MRRVVGVGVIMAISASACGGARGPSSGVRHAAAAAAITVVAAAAAELARSHRRHRTETGYESSDDSDPYEPPARDDVGDTEPPPAGGQVRPLSLWQVPYAVEVNAEDLWCNQDDDCTRVSAADGCPSDEGGVDVAVRRDSSERIRAELADAEPTRPCPGHADVSLDYRVACVDSLCRLLPPAPPEPVPPPPQRRSASEGLPPVPPPPGAPEPGDLGPVPQPP